MATMIDLEGELRDASGKRSARRARREGKAPAVLYGAGRPARMLSFSSEVLNRQLEDPTFRARVLNVRVGDKSQPAIVKDVQRHPSSNHGPAYRPAARAGRGDHPHGRAHQPAQRRSIAGREDGR